MGGRNEQASLRTRKAAYGDNRTMESVKILKISSNTSANTYEIDEPERGTVATNELDSNADTCCLGVNFIIMNMTERTADVYPYDPSYKPLHNVPIVTGATTVMNTANGRSFIMIINEALYYGKKLGHSLINPNQFRRYGTMVWDNPFDPLREIFIETGDGDIIELISNGTKIGFESHAPTEEELRTLPHVEVTSASNWNPSTVKLSKIDLNNNDTCYQKSSIGDCLNEDELVLRSINSVLVHMGDALKRNASKVVTPFEDDIPERRTFISHERHLKASAESIADLWCIGLKKAYATLDATTQKGTRSARHIATIK